MIRTDVKVHFAGNTLKLFLCEGSEELKERHTSLGLSGTQKLSSLVFDISDEMF